jgi:hypothetical protein
MEWNFFVFFNFQKIGQPSWGRRNKKKEKKQEPNAVTVPVRAPF